MAKFLIIRFSSIGDIVLTTPVIRCLKMQVADAEVHFLTKKQFGGIIASNPWVDKLHLLQEDVHSQIEALKNEKFDYIIDLHHNLRTLKFKRALKVKSYSFHKLNMEKWMLTAFKINRLPDRHIVDRNLATLADFGVKNDGLGLNYFIPESDKISEEDIPHAHLAGYVGIVIGAALATKQLPVDALQQLCNAIEYPIILLGGPEDRANGDLIAATDELKIYNACGRFSLNESADLVNRARLIISHDTGLMHIAAAFKKPIICIWGNTVPQFGMYPYYGDAHITHTNFEVNNLRCRPCSKIGYKKCPKGHFKCMRRQPIDQIAARAMQMLKGDA